MAECKACGHRDTQHAKFGCNQGFCKCEMSNQDVIDFDKLAALREAGEKMAEQLRAFKETADNEGWWDSHGDILVTFNKDMLWNDLDAAALAEWEAANK